MATLLELAKQARTVQDLIEQSQGEITPEVDSMLSVQEISLPAKVDGYGAVLDQLQTSSAYYKKMAKEYSQAAKACDRATEFLSGRLASAMKELKTDRLSGERYTFSEVSCQQALEITDDKLIPSEYKMQAVEILTDKERVKNALLDGFSVPGAKLVGGTYVKKSIKKG